MGKHKQVTPLNDEEQLGGARNADEGCARAMQNGCYQFLAVTLWDSIVSGFSPGRERAIELLEIQATDRVLLVGEGSGLDFAHLPPQTDKQALQAFDFSSQMVRQAKQKAAQLGIPQENCFEGDAQALPYTTQQFDKIYFPLSLGSIPNPQLALKEAERVLAPQGKIVVFEKLLDDGKTASGGRKCLNLFTSCIFADINRNLTDMLGKDTTLKITQYESLENKLGGFFARHAGAHYRIGVLTKSAEHADRPSVRAMVMK